ncbi:hypothetical protein BH23PSE1_BH23PSE1_02950 [soil metagenome]
MERFLNWSDRAEPASGSASECSGDWSVAGLRHEQGAVQRFLVGLEPLHAWGLGQADDEPEEVVIPGLLLDDFDHCTCIEAVMSVRHFCQLQSLALLAENRMLLARAMAAAHRLVPEANVWLVEGRLAGRTLEATGIVGLDRLVLERERTQRVDTLSLCDIIPNGRGAGEG